MITKWQIKNPDEKAVNELAMKGGLSVLAAKALVSAGIDTIEKAADFFGQSDEYDEAETDCRGMPVPAFGKGYSDPSLIRDMDKACELVSDAIDSGELICVYGDYDCDGVTAAAVLTGYLRDIGGNVMTYINEREQGYGMNTEAVKYLAEKGVKTIITVDNGISAIAEAELCGELGITLVITDHHQPGETLPPAAAVVDPHRRDCPSTYKNFCGCGLVLKFIAAMEGGDMECAVEQYSDLAAIATIADVVPLTGENREIVRHGLHYLENTENPGLQALISKAGLKPPYTSSSAAFGIAPRINAAGRIGSPSDALRLLLEEDESEADSLAEKICRLNTERKEYENAVIADIAAQIRKDPTILDKRVLVFCGTGWHHGVVGIAAAKCMEKFGKPVFLMSSNNGESEARGSARSIDGFNVFKALSYCSELLDKFGGHSGAGGFSLDRSKVHEFDEKMQEYAHMCAAEGISVQPSVTVCGAVSPSELSAELVEGLNILEPFGEGNPRPVFLLADCVINDIIPLSGGAHTKLMLTSKNTSFTGLMFGTKTDEFPYKRGDETNLLISPELNVYNNRKSVNLRIIDIRRKGLSQPKLIAAEETYYAFRRGEKTDSRLIPRITPERADLAAVYKALGHDRISPLALYGRVCGTDMNYCKFLICLDVFDESGLIDYDRCAGKASIIPNAPKADTQLAPTMIKLRAMQSAQ